MSTRRARTVSERSPNENNIAERKRQKISPIHLRNCFRNTTFMNSLKRAFGTQIKQLVVKPRERIRFPRTTGRLFFILIKKYFPTSTLHSAHAISAVVSNGILFVFDPWGRDRKVTTDIVAKKIATRYNLFLKIYNGPNLQIGNRYGVCTAFALNFLRIFGTKSISLNNFNKNVANQIIPPNARTFQLASAGISTIRRTT